MAKVSRSALYFRPYVKGQPRCPVQIRSIGKQKVGIFPLKGIQCKRAVERAEKTVPEFQGCVFTWHDEPEKTVPRSSLDLGHDPAEVTDDPMKWLGREPMPNFWWFCKDKLHVGEWIGR